MSNKSMRGLTAKVEDEDVEPEASSRDVQITEPRENTELGKHESKIIDNIADNLLILYH